MRNGRMPSVGRARWWKARDKDFCWIGIRVEITEDKRGEATIRTPNTMRRQPNSSFFNYFINIWLTTYWWHSWYVSLSLYIYFQLEINLFYLWLIFILGLPAVICICAFEQETLYSFYIKHQIFHLLLLGYEKLLPSCCSIFIILKTFFKIFLCSN